MTDPLQAAEAELSRLIGEMLLVQQRAAGQEHLGGVRAGLAKKENRLREELEHTEDLAPWIVAATKIHDLGGAERSLAATAQLLGVQPHQVRNARAILAKQAILAEREAER